MVVLHFGVIKINNNNSNNSCSSGRSYCHSRPRKNT